MSFDISALLDSMLGIQDSWLDAREGTRTRAASNPCQAEAEIKSYIGETIDPRINRERGKPAALAGAGHVAVMSALRNYGRDKPSKYREAMPFARFLWEQGYLDDERIRAIPAGATRWHAIDEHLPPVGSLQSLRNDKRGTRVGPEIWCFYRPDSDRQDNFRKGTLRGPGLFDAYKVWRTEIQDTVEIPEAGVEWRKQLLTAVGRSRQDWRIWVPGDPYQPESRFWGWQDTRNTILADAERNHAECVKMRNGGGGRDSRPPVPGDGVWLGDPRFRGGPGGPAKLAPVGGGGGGVVLAGLGLLLLVGVVGAR